MARQGDAELRAIGAVIAALEALPDDEARRRAVNYALDRCTAKRKDYPIGLNQISAQQAAYAQQAAGHKGLIG
jgi:hypothetical protein